MITSVKEQKDFIKSYRVILSILLLEIIIYFISNIHVSTFVNNTFINFEQDPLLWLMYFTGLPQLILSNIYVCYFIDIALLGNLIYLILKPDKQFAAITLLLLLLVFYAVFTAHLGHRNYQSGYLLILLPLLFKKLKNKQIVFDFTRYFLLFFYASAAFFKIKNGSLFSMDHFSHAVIQQYTPYFLEQSFSIRTNFNIYIITHPQAATFLYCAATLFELITLIGFFTKRFDKQLAICILIFHLANWFVMDIAPIGHIAFICALFFSKKLAWKTSF